MKISSVSKKVLCTALSAATALAFAPAVALADVHELDKVNVKFDTTGLTLADGSSAISDQEGVAVSENNKVTLDPSVTSGHSYKLGDEEITGWYWDVDGDGECTEADVELAGGVVLDFSTDTVAAAAVADGSTITLSPLYNASSAVALDVEGLTVPQQQTDGDYDGELSIPMTVKTGVTSARVSISKNGSDIAHYVKNLTVGGSPLTFSFQASTGIDSSKIKASAWGAGTYTVTVKDTDKDAVVATAEFNVIEAKLDGVFGADGTPTDGQKVLAVVGTSWADVLNNAKVAQAQDKVNGDYAVKKVDGYRAGGADVVSYSVAGGKEERAGWYACEDANGEPAAVEAGQTSLDPVYSHDAEVKAVFDGDMISAWATNATAGGNEVAWSDAEVTYELTGPNGLSVTKKSSDADENCDLYDFGSATAPAGTYTVRASVVENGDDPAAKKVTDLGSYSFEVAVATFDAGSEGTADAREFAFMLGSQYTSLYDVLYYASVGVAVKDDRKHTFCGWSLDGAHVVTSADKVAAGTTAVALKAVYHTLADDAYEPAYSYADKQITLSTDKGDGYEVYYTTSDPSNDVNNVDTKYTGPIAADPDAKNPVTVYACVKYTKGDGKGADSEVIAIAPTKNAAAGLKTWADEVLNVAASDDSAAAPKRYKDALTTAASDAEAAVEAIGYASEKDTAAAVLEQKKAVVAKVAAYESAQVQAYAQGVADKDGNVKKVNGTQAAAAEEAIDQVLSDLDIATGTDTTVATAGKYNGVKVNGGEYKDSFDSTEASYFVAAITEAGKDLADSATEYAKADVEAAAAFDAQVAALPAEVTDENYEEALGAAEAAVEAYQALTEAQKALVTADVTYAFSTQVAALEKKQAIEIAASEAEKKKLEVELAQAQDALAVASVADSKTVKAKSKKRVTASIKGATSLTGNKVTFSKYSGNKKVTVSAAGKIKVKKGLKKGKKYAVKAIASCGDQSKLIKITVKVVK